MASRLYFFDALTGEELVTFAHHGAEPRMGHGSGVSARSGIRYTDTCWGVTVMSRGKRVEITAANFPGRLVVVKDWCGGKVIARDLLIAEGDGFVKSDDTGRAEILGDRKALEWIAARRAARANVAA